MAHPRVTASNPTLSHICLILRNKVTASLTCSINSPTAVLLRLLANMAEVRPLFLLAGYHSGIPRANVLTFSSKLLGAPSGSHRNFTHRRRSKGLVLPDSRRMVHQFQAIPLSQDSHLISSSLGHQPPASFPQQASLEPPR